MSFLNKFAVDGRFGVASGSYAAAKAAGYSDKQIAVAITQNQHGLKVGQKLLPGSAKHNAMASSTAGSPNNWIYNYQDPSGSVGMGSLQKAINDGRSTSELMQAGYTIGGPGSWGVTGFGKQASSFLLDQQATEDEEMWAERMANIPTAAQLMASMPKPKIRAGQDYATTGRSARGMKIKKGTKFAEGSKHGTKGYFGRGAKFTGDVTPAMNISGGSQSMNQA